MRRKGEEDIDLAGASVSSPMFRFRLSTMNMRRKGEEDIDLAGTSVSTPMFIGYQLCEYEEEG